MPACETPTLAFTNPEQIMNPNLFIQTLAQTRQREGGHAARDFVRHYLTGIEQSKGERAALDFLYEAASLAIDAAPPIHRPEVDSQTIEAFRAATDAANKAANSHYAGALWNGEATLRLLESVCRDLSDLAVKQRLNACALPSVELHSLRRIPVRLHMAMMRLLAEAIPAIHQHALEKAEATLGIKAVQNFADAVTRIYLMPNFYEMRREDAQLQEPANLIALEGPTLVSLQAVCNVFHLVTMLAEVHAPRSNPQARMVAAECTQLRETLESTLRDCAGLSDLITSAALVGP
jgi:hypothetical protein